MTIKLNRATFRRLVQLHILSAIVSVALLVRQFIIPSWVNFSTGFDDLVATHFGAAESPDWIMWPAVAGMIALAVWMVASMFGLLWFKRWARLGTWASAAGFFVLMVAAFGAQPAFTAPMDDVLAMVDSALFGAIVLLSYAKGYGADWFARPAMRVEE